MKIDLAKKTYCRDSRILILLDFVITYDYFTFGMEFLEIVIEEFPEAVFIAEVDTGIIIYANKSAEKLLGLPKDKIIGIHQSQLHPPKDSEFYKKVFEEDRKIKTNYPKKRKTQKQGDLYVQHSSGKIIPIEIYSRTFEYNHKKFIIGLFLDRTKNKKIERKLDALNKILLESEDIFNQGSFQYNLFHQNPFIFLSDGARKIFNIPYNFARFSKLHEIIIEDQKEKFKAFLLNISLDENLKEKKFIKKEEFLILVNNSLKLLSIQLFLLDQQNILGIIKDITEAKEQLNLIQIKNRHLKMLSECHKVLLYAQEEEVLLKQICKVIVETGGYKIAWIGYKKYDKEKNIEIVAYYTKDHESENYINNLKLNWRDDNPYGMGPAGISCREGKIDIEHNIIFSERFKPIRELALKSGIQSVIGIPIYFIDRVIGCLLVYSSLPEAFAKEEVDILKELALNLGFGINLLRERKTKIKLLEQNILLTKVLDNTNVGVIVVSNSGKILYINRKFEEISGYLMNELLGQNINILKSGLHDDEFYKNIWRTLLNRQDWRGEIINKRKDGSLFLSRNFISPIVNEKNEVSHFIQIIEDITLEKYYQEQIEKTKFYDELTKLPNRNFFIEKLNQEIYNEKVFYLLYVDIDQFSQLSYKEGFIIADRFLVEFAMNLESFINLKNNGKNIFLARIGNDEFGIIIKDFSLQQTIKFIEELLNSIKRNYVIDEKEYFLSASVGIAIFPDNAKTPDELLRLAEIASKRARDEKGSGSFALLKQEMEKEILENAQIETQLQINVYTLQTKEKTKVEKTGFYLEYQPIYDLKTNQIVSLEALIRWKNPNMGMIPPSKFIPIAEKNRLIIPLGEFILEEVLKQMVQWQEKNFPIIPIGVNISYIQLQHPDFIKKLKALLKEYLIDPKLLEFEITENAILQEEALAKKILEELKDMKIKLLIDDFGIGYSSLSYLLKYPFDIIKIDQIFIKNLTNNHSKDLQALKLVRAIIQISKNLNLKTIAEGIETEEQKKILLKEGCDLGQGYIFSKPLSSQEIEIMLKKKNGK